MRTDDRVSRAELDALKGELRNIELNLDQQQRRLQQQVNRPKRPLYIPVTQFSGYLNDAFLGNGNPALEEINSLDVVGARIAAVDDTCNHLFFVPKDFNVDTNIKFEVVWCTSSVDTTETATWEVEYSAIAAGETLVAAATALDTVISADNVLGAYKVAVAPFGLLRGKVLEHGDLLHLKVSLAAVSGLNPAVDTVFLLGILINDEG